METSPDLEGSATPRKANTAMSGVKRKLMQNELNEMRNRHKVSKLANEVISDTTGTSVFDLTRADKVISASQDFVNADNTELQQGKVVFKVLAGNEYIQFDTLRFLFNMQMKKSVTGGADSSITDADKIIVLPNFLRNLLGYELEIKIISPSGTVDSTLINLKQDDLQHLSKYQVSREYDQNFLEKVAKNEYGTIKEWCYDTEFTGTNANAANTQDGRFEERPHNQVLTLKNKTVQKYGETWAKALYGDGKEFDIPAKFINPAFSGFFIPPNHGVEIVIKLPKKEDHVRYYETYKTLTAATTPEASYYFEINKAKDVQCHFQRVILSSAAEREYNSLFADGKDVEVNKFLVVQKSMRQADQGVKEIQNMPLPKTQMLPEWVALELKNSKNYYHTSAYHNDSDQSFVNDVKSIRVHNGTNLNVTPRANGDVIDLNDRTTKHWMYNNMQRWMLGSQHVSMSQFYGKEILNGAPNDLLNNKSFETKTIALDKTARHTSPVILSLDPTQGFYPPGQTASRMPNNGVELTFTFENPIDKPSVLIMYSAYIGRFVQRKSSNGVLEMVYSGDIPSNLL